MNCGGDSLSSYNIEEYSFRFEFINSFFFKFFSVIFLVYFVSFFNITCINQSMIVYTFIFRKLDPKL